ncbi:hypothetical protein A2973_03075 [Candidatus Gottesmanbacteria bacterium RIFCSPLOWO2_01_FULL_49_10]|uniref:Prepilin-type N-terminal cleavage/methylation domain-containing protein n=1 Tax=Candidatus Gottesmanbacteria bacterium RIFCSPLOWO2_01_FULL_49_10 TaxID=1798396 RepID=A0A1F6B1D6_9BACT|nr:MAG: hypothetical protein A2973_03075 [Candidatus Gottesmanbacteria bacterium RIFCSPLOWO2_01_FULL_49_10]
MKERNVFYHHGFTLIELIVTITIMSMIGILIAQVFFTTSRTNTKTELVKEAKQNGEYALGFIERMIRNSRYVTSACAGSADTSITITNPDAGSTTFLCVQDGSLFRIASQSASGIEYLTSRSVTLGGADCASSSLVITCTPSGGKPAFIGVAFSLSQIGTPVDQFQKASASFQTDITLRN